MHRTIVQYKMINIICSCFFFIFANIYWSSLEKVRLGRPDPKPIQPLNFYLRENTHPTQNCMHYNGLEPDFPFWYAFIFKKYLKICIKKPVKIVSDKIFWPENWAPIHWEVFADVNTIYFTTFRWIMNVWSSFGTLKTQLLGKLILIIFLLWRRIKYIFVLFILKRCLELGVLLWNLLGLLYSLHKEIGAGSSSGAPFS